jgi:hypothetical protein
LCPLCRHRPLLRSEVDDKVCDLPTAVVRRMMEEGRAKRTNWAATSSIGRPFLACLPFSMSATPSDRVGPGNTALTVTLVPAIRLASPRESARTAVLVTP